MRYPGGKGAAGVHQTIINLMPRHRVYIEPFIGGGNIFERKAPAQSSIVIDADAVPVAHWIEQGDPCTTVIHGDGIAFLREYDFRGDELVYCDPPYVMSARSGRKMYKHEMTDRQHMDLCTTLLMIPTQVMISGYGNPIYDDAFTAWHRTDFQAMTRGGVRTESLWMNFAPPAVPGELTFLGGNFRERERIKRKKARWALKLGKLPIAEQAAIMEVLRDLASSHLAIGDGNGG